MPETKRCRSKWGFRRKVAYSSVMAIISTAVLLAFLEVGYLYISRNPGSIPNNPLVYPLRVAYHSNRDLIQYNILCAKYDTRLTYTLRPGSCTFSGVEFSTFYRINRLGLRDDEDSLFHPEILVLGDSHAMGWGVEQEETFPQLLEERLGLKVLNSAISSYGTARQMALLELLDLSRIKAVVIQYCTNDFAENSQFLHTQKRNVTPEETYNWIVDDLEKAKAYYFGKYVARTMNVQIFRRIGRAFSKHPHPHPTGPAPRASDHRGEAEMFLKLLKTKVDLFNGSPIIVLSIDSYRAGPDAFLSALETMVAREGKNFPPLRVLRLSEILNDKHFFLLDDHLNSKGHYAISKELESVIMASIELSATTGEPLGARDGER